VKVAVRVAALEILHGLVVPVQVLVLVPLPLVPGVLHPPKPNDAVGAVTGVAVKVTCDTPLNVAVQVGGQLIPAGLLVTVPSPAPASSIATSFTPGCRPWHPNSANTDTRAARPATHRQMICEILFNSGTWMKLAENWLVVAVEVLAYSGKYGDSRPFENPDNGGG